MDPKKMLAFFCMLLGMFLSVLDVQIVSAALHEIQAALSANSEEIAWVQTGYLVAKVVVIPLTGFLLRAFSTRHTFVYACAGFTLSSALCATSSSIEEMIFWRAMQGLTGGAMIPAVFSTAFSIFPGSKQYMIGPTIALVVTLAPTIGPTVGGYITDFASWHWLFLINIIPGIVISVVCWTIIDFDKPEPSLLQNFDWWGLLSMAAFLGALQFVLQEGARWDWFDSIEIRIATLVSATGAVFFFWRCFTARQPIVDLTAFLNRNYSVGCVLSFVLGFALFGLTYFYPIYLERVRDHSALMIGEVMFVSGACMFLMAPVAGRLTKTLDLRIVISIGFFLLGVSMFLASSLTVDWDFNELIIPQALRGCGLILCQTSVNFIALGTLSPDQLKNAAALYNLTRNMGGAVGIALMTTMLNQRTDFHLDRMRENVTWARAEPLEWLKIMSGRMSELGSDAELAALKRLAQVVRKQATVMAIGDVFFLLAVGFFLMLVLVPLAQKPRAGAGGRRH
ncbi:MAG: DHA2 family efflux MFS transporter permease subunit [Hyphomicrobiaceae bacterium]|nr:DHA2 family efflux MFS transporter permease subunit [Hyphomicrobiaceae bacterium]